MIKVDITDELAGSLLEGQDVLARGTVRQAMGATSLLLSPETGELVPKAIDLVLAVETSSGKVEVVPVDHVNATPTGWLLHVTSPLPELPVVGAPWVMGVSNTQLTPLARPSGEKLLMSADNPDGHKLEGLLQKIIDEVKEKSAKIAGDVRPIAQHVLTNNHAIIGLLTQAKSHQEASLQALDAHAPNMGPLGQPRIGMGSAGYEEDATGRSSDEAQTVANSGTVSASGSHGNAGTFDAGSFANIGSLDTKGAETPSTAYNKTETGTRLHDVKETDPGKVDAVEGEDVTPTDKDRGPYAAPGETVSNAPMGHAQTDKPAAPDMTPPAS